MTTARDLFARSNRIVRNTGWLFFDRVARMVIGLVIGAWVARYLGPEQYGELALSIALTGIFQVVSQLGLDNIAIRDMSRKPESAPDILGTVLRLRLVSGALSYLLSLIAISLLRPADTQALVLVAVVSATNIFQPADTIDLWFQSTLQSKKSVMAKGLAFLFTSGLRVIFITQELPLLAFAALILIEACFSAVALAILYARKPTMHRWHWHRITGQNLLHETVPFFISGLALTLYLQVDRLMLDALLGAGMLGLYSVALTISSAFNFIPVAICISLAASISRLQSDSDKFRYFVKLNALLLWLGLALSLVLYFLADFLISALLGIEYLASAHILEIHAIALAFIFISVANDYYSLSTKNGRVTLIRTLAGLGINIALNCLLIPRFGVTGAAISSLIAHALSNTVVYWMCMPDSARIFVTALMLPIQTLRNCMSSSSRNSQ